ncbi:Kunitz/Bovine pancreatic trypsin inhibitor domain protein [Ancylostoma ceylanicum]|uniref:Kunitz/Bovine pancreatic trypsin inhibitor domain protein n=1 Tax=Ancylostoma ceylanicum TaxID=53326 RepID=A0A0D6M4H3_9BILA|nr:Kunitz/Bovine pancreatic trypsin inhibitor domain protein [Ancylostoma ceylanicum]
MCSLILPATISSFRSPPAGDEFFMKIKAPKATPPASVPSNPLRRCTFRAYNGLSKRSGGNKTRSQPGAILHAKSPMPYTCLGYKTILLSPSFTGQIRSNHNAIRKIDVESSSYLICSEGTYRQRQCSDDGRTHFSATTLECVDPATLTFHAQGTSGSGRVGDVCTFNTDCLSGMYCAIGQCRCLSTYIAVDAYCYERISPSESGCFYDVQCSAVWPDAYCKNGQCQCPSQDMVAVKTRDGTLCLWSSPTEPSCPLPSLPPPDSAAALVVLPAPSAKNTVSIATCNPHASSIPATEELLLTKAHEHKCAVRGSVDDTTPKDVSDLYDCIDNSKFWQGQGLDTNSHPVGVCCMNRAFTCQQPKRGESDELGSVPRWWFNGVIGSCQQFLFDPSSSEVSPNNFETLDHCESFCKDTCPRGNPAYIATRTDLGQIPQGGCTITQPCADPFECTEVASQSLCCPSRKSICSESGGRSKNPLRSTPYDAGMRFDQLTGEQANYAVGISTSTSRSDNLACFAGDGNERESKEKNPKKHGTLGYNALMVTHSRLVMVYLNAVSGMLTVLPPTPAPLNMQYAALHLKLSVRNHFEWETASSPLGNSGTMRKHALVKPNQNALKAEPMLSILVNFCNAVMALAETLVLQIMSVILMVMYTDAAQAKLSKVLPVVLVPATVTITTISSRNASRSFSLVVMATPTIFQRMKNVKVTAKLQSVRMAVPRSDLTLSCGHAQQQIHARFYFNVALQTCSPYTSNGCDSSLNSFKTLMECEDFCLSAGCKPGDTVYKDPNTNRPFLCNTALQNNCPTNYQCTLNSLTQEHVCCGSDSMGVCPAGEKAFVDPMSSTPRQCAMAADGKCPAGYLCRFSQNNHKYYCCGSISGSLCPAGRALFRYAATQLPLQCSIAHGGGACPPSYSCQSDVPGAFQGYCCSQHPVCPGGVDFHVDEKSQMPTTCTSEGFALCPNGYTCQQQPETINFYCCAGRDKEGINDGCPPSQYAYVADGQVKSCDPFNVDDDGCPRKQFALLDRRNNQPRVCTAGEEKSCPTGFFCQFSAKRGQFQCCGQSGGCPSRRAAFIAIDGNAQECLPGPDMCADGYECVLSAYGNGKNICCSKEENECAENEKMIGGKCVVQVKIGGACHKDAECGGGSKCIAHSCTCASDQDAVNDECVARACESNQIILEGKCVDRAAFGESCKSSLQCVSNMRCLSGRCDCGKGEKAEGNNCVKISEESKKSRPKNNDVCPNESEHAFFERGTTRMRYCSQIADDCPKGYSCQYSDLVKQNICCGEGDGDEEKKPKLGKPKGSTASNPGHCPSGMTPYLLNGKPKSCSSGTCPYGFECKFSSSKKNYYCCSKVMKKTNHLRRDGGCERGAVLLYPATQEPVHCDLKTRGCPNGYLCLPHTATKLDLAHLDKQP